MKKLFFLFPFICIFAKAQTTNILITGNKTNTTGPVVLRSTNSTVTNYIIFGNGNIILVGTNTASWPQFVPFPGAIALVGSNGTLYALTPASNSAVNTNWAATTKIAP